MNRKVNEGLQRFDVEMADPLLSNQISRRAFLASSGIAVAALTTSCGSGGGSSNIASTGNNAASGSNVSVINQSVSISSSQVGTSTNQANSAYQQPPALPPSPGPSPQPGSGGLFTSSTPVSKDAAQLISAQDTSGNTRGLAVSIPSPQNDGSQPVLVDATSTAAALIFASPGVLANEPSTATDRYQQIINLSTFSDLVDLPALGGRNSPRWSGWLLPHVPDHF